MCTSAIIMSSCSDGGQSGVRGIRVSTLLSEFCIIQVLEGPKKPSALQNSKVSIFGSISIVLTALQPGQRQVAT